jgi:RNA polymerase sigma-70 factor (ECF subfamily)
VVLDALGFGGAAGVVLHDMFAVPFDEIAPIVGRPATRQLRARRRVRAVDAVPDASRQCAGDAFLAAVIAAPRDRRRAPRSPDHSDDLHDRRGPDHQNTERLAQLDFAILG